MVLVILNYIRSNRGPIFSEITIVYMLAKKKSGLVVSYGYRWLKLELSDSEFGKF